MRICLDHKYIMGFKINHMDNDGFIWFVHHPSEDLSHSDCRPEAKYVARYFWKWGERYGKGTPRYLNRFRSDTVIRNRVKRLIQ
jgi:hypothetical protein